MKIDIVIPVYNNPTGTKKCIDSIYEFMPHVINKVYIHDNVSDKETIDMLKQLHYPKLEIHFSDENVGYGKAVNRMFKKVTTDLVLMQSSDTVVLDDFLTPMIETMEQYPELGILNPNGERYYRKSFDNYDISKGFLEAFNLSGYAFLVRKKVFEKECGFNSLYGKGYCEDLELGRKIILQNKKIGVHVTSYLMHEHQGSFKNVSGVNELLMKNALIYYDRYPNSKLRLIYVRKNTNWEDISIQEKHYLKQILHDGGKIFLLANLLTQKLPFLEIKFFKLTIYRLFKLMRLSVKKKDDICIKLLVDKDITFFNKMKVCLLAKIFNIENISNKNL